MPDIDFPAAYQALTGNLPFPWHQALYKRFVADRSDNIPASCNIPTGLGKTSVLAVWLIALANQPGKIPRRLAYVVNRRTVVDQTTTEITNMRDRLIGEYGPPPKILWQLRTLLEAMTALPSSAPLAISTLRGQFADNREWSADPSRPAVICGTVDMIGSRLLFSGYGVGFKGKPLHAGFLGQDVLLVHDEAHLEPAFQQLIVDIEKEQRDGERTRDLPWNKLRVLEMTATSRSEADQFPNADERTANERDPTVQQRIEARKRVFLHENTDPKKLADNMAEFLLDPQNMFLDSMRPILVFVRKVEDVEKLVAKLHKSNQQVQPLTGTVRGKERDELVEDAIFRRFLPNAVPKDETVFLVCTSAGEVGVNISADHLVCDLSTFESMAQRFGRVNRFGLLSDTEIHVFHPTEFDPNDEYDARLQKTLALMERLNCSGSPKALADLDVDQRKAAFAPTPTILPVSDILFDAWALTTIGDKLPGRPPVEPYLHGIAGWQPPETHVAWREEVGLITGELLKTNRPKDLLEDYPLKPHELLRDRSDRVLDRLKKLKAAPTTPVWIVSNDGSVDVFMFSQLVEADKTALSYRTVLLPPSAGGLKEGMLTSDSLHANDVADEWKDENDVPRRIRVWDDDSVPDDMRLIRTIDTNPDADETEDEQTTAPRFWDWYELPRVGDSDGSKSNKKPVLWQVHTDDVVKNVSEIVAKSALSEELKRTLIWAAKFHDLGKRRSLFQKILGNRDPTRLLAKSGQKSGHVPEQYRHEFGSLIDVLDENEFCNLEDCPQLRDLILHLIAVHHGYGRPHFPPDQAFDPEPRGKNLAHIAAEVPQRFARLQRKYGRWGLAYLESLLRAADWAASAKPSREEES